jgi:hypothetical protein
MAADPVADARPQTKPFAAWLQEQRNGGLHGELSDALADLVAACLEHGRQGTLTLKVDVKPNKDGVTLLVTDEVKVRAPEADRPPALFFADAHGNLSRSNPHQPELPVREVPARDDAPVRDLEGTG